MDKTPSETITFWQLVGYILMLPFLTIFILLAFVWEMHQNRNYGGLALSVIIFVVFIAVMNDWAPPNY